MTALGACSAVPAATEQAAAILPFFVEMDDLQRLASRAIAAATGAEAGFVTAGASAGITLCVAAAMAGADPARIAQLPDTAGLRDSVAIQRGHLVDYGAPLDQAIRLAGARIVAVGTERRAEIAELASALDETIAAGLYVVSHHVLPYEQIPLPDFVAECRGLHIPVIVDAASEYDLTGFLGAGADLVIYSAHKFLGGLTAGLVAGRKDLIRAAYLQNFGIGRGFKVGKEGMLGAVAALEAWSHRDHGAHRRLEDARVAFWQERLSSLAGIRTDPSPDPTGNPINRLRVYVDPASGTTAWDLAEAMASGPRPVFVRDDEIRQGYFELDPCNLSDGEAEEVASRLAADLGRLSGARSTAFSEWQARRLSARLAWPD